jgi:hypothetical protein
MSGLSSAFAAWAVTIIAAPVRIAPSRIVASRFLVFSLHDSHSAEDRQQQLAAGRTARNSRIRERLARQFLAENQNPY